jgi:hypothetical protein
LNIIVLIASQRLPAPQSLLAPAQVAFARHADPSRHAKNLTRTDDAQAPAPLPLICSAEVADTRPKCGPGNGVFDCMPSVRDAKPVPRRALATFLQNDAYLAGALTLAYTLRKHGNVLPMMMYNIRGLGQLSPVARELAECAGWQIREVEGIAPYKETAEVFHHQCALPPLNLSWPTLGLPHFQECCIERCAEACASYHSGRATVRWLPPPSPPQHHMFMVLRHSTAKSPEVIHSRGRSWPILCELLLSLQVHKVAALGRGG